MKDRIERDKSGGIFRISFCELIPNDYHCNASGETDDDESRHIFWVSAEEQDRQEEHENGSDDPVLHEGKNKNLRVLENVPQLFVFDLCQRGIHHEDKPNCDWDICRAALKCVPEPHDARDGIPGQHAECHREKDPHS